VAINAAPPTNTQYASFVEALRWRDGGELSSGRGMVVGGRAECSAQRLDILASFVDSTKEQADPGDAVRAGVEARARLGRADAAQSDDVAAPRRPGPQAREADRLLVVAR
jgi:hypothetical protein